MMDLFTYPQSPGYRQRETSRAAAEHITPCAKTLREKALQCLSEPLTADEVAERLGVSILAIRPRVTELAKLGKVEDSGTRRKNSSGRQDPLRGQTERRLYDALKGIVDRIRDGGTIKPTSPLMRIACEALLAARGETL